MKFSIIIPAFNEEDSVENILHRCLKAAESIKKSELGIDEVEIFLVNDGSKDRTEEFARKVPGVRVLSHAINRGYGAAIKTGFEEAKGEWVGFLDADGTCDPEVFQGLLSAGQKGKLDVVLGSRMHKDSRMPVVRRLGNWFFKTVVNLIAATDVTDTASGMRVIRREALERLYPLPDGLHFTPAMSVRAILDPGLKIGEMPMPYEERVGRSKLSVVQDGVRFLGIILTTAMTYRPALFFGAVAGLLSVPALLLLFFQLGGQTEAPVPFYLRNRFIADWMFFRLLLATVLISTAVFLASLGQVAQTLVSVINRERQESLRGAFLGRFPLWGALSLAVAAFFVRRPLLSYWRTGEIPMDFWAFPVAGALFIMIGVEFIGFYAVAEIARLLWDRERYRRRKEDRR
ncbi:MAG: glycosyltransferase family 2 protein [Elusimicrobiota bacterium]